MKLIDLIAHLREHNCLFLREGSNHSIYINKDNGEITAVPRHREINKYTAKNICKDLKIPLPFN